jgi:putative transposase
VLTAASWWGQEQSSETDPSVDVPWSGFDLIDRFHQWKRSEAAGRIFTATGDGAVTKRVTGLAWRHEVSAQVFEEAAVDLGRALAAFSDSRSGTRMGPTIGFPKPNGKGVARTASDGTIRVYEDTRCLRRLFRPVGQYDSRTGEEFVAPRAKILFATIARRADRWYVSLTVHAPDFHAQRRHHFHDSQSQAGFVGVDRGLDQFAVTANADGTEVSR